MPEYYESEQESRADQPQGQNVPQPPKTVDTFYATAEVDSQICANMEETLLETMKMTAFKETRPYDVQLYITVSLEKCRNFLFKYKSSVDEFDSNLLSDIQTTLVGIINNWTIDVQCSVFADIQERVVICVAEKLGYRKQLRPSTDWASKLMLHQLIPESAELDKIMYGDGTKVMKIAKFMDYTVQKEHFAQIVIISGSVGLGKSTTAVELATLIAEGRGEKFDLTNRHGIYYTDIEGLYLRLMSTYNQIVILDEGIWSLSNFDTLKRESKNIVGVLTASRNRGHIIFIIFTRLQRATKAVLELGTIWLHKPHRESCLMQCKPKLYTGSDPWNLKTLDKSESMMQVSVQLTSHRNYICEFSCKKMPPEVEEVYEKNKRAAQEEMAIAISNAESEEKIRANITSKMLAAYEAGEFTRKEAKTYLLHEMKVPLNLITKYYGWFNKALTNAGITNTSQENLRINQEEDVTR